MTNPSPDQGVTFTVKELLKQLSDELGRQLNNMQSTLTAIDSKIDRKADVARVEALEGRAKAAEDRLNALELGAAGSAAVSRFKTVLVSAAAAWALVCLALLVFIITKGHA